MNKITRLNLCDVLHSTADLFGLIGGLKSLKIHRGPTMAHMYSMCAVPKLSKTPCLYLEQAITVTPNV